MKSVSWKLSVFSNIEQFVTNSALWTFDQLFKKMAEELIAETEALFKLLKNQGLALRKRAHSKDLQEGDKYFYCCLFKDFKEWESGIIQEFYAKAEELKATGEDEAIAFYDNVVFLDYDPQVANLVSFITDALEGNNEGGDSVSQLKSRSNRNKNNSVLYESRESLIEEPEQTAVDRQQTVHSRPQDSVSAMPQSTASTGSIHSQIAGLMDKPKHEIKKFSGDPLQYQRFIRQLNAQAFRYCDDDEEKFAYLEQFTEGHANSLVGAFAHKLIGKFQAALNALEERYGDHDVVASHYLDKVLKFPAFNIGDSDSLEKFSFILMECNNAAPSDDSLQALGNMRR